MAKETGAPDDRAIVGDDAIASLLGRSTVNVDVERFGAYLTGATVLVTGAGGSIAAELCAHLVHLGVGRLVLVDQAEAAVVRAARTLTDDLGFANAAPVLADITSAPRMGEIFERHRPEFVFHAAAYKNVPLLEAFPVEGVATNVLGTKCLVDAATRTRVRGFVLFSTDKAVEPTSILGQTKSVAEWIVATAGREVAFGEYASVRLVNVVDSAGSILPVFRQQIARGGPLTVTHPAATRFLMTAEEAARVAIVAGALADSIRGATFWLDVGPPVNILDLAQRLASASSPDCAVEFVGLRAGERLHESLCSKGEDVTPTPCEHVWRASMAPVDPAWLSRWLALLEYHVKNASATGVRAALTEMHSAPKRQSVGPAAAVA